MIDNISRVNEETFIPIKDDKIACNYDGFISPDGDFYKVSIRNKHTPTHHEWANVYINKKTDYNKIMQTPSVKLLYTASRLHSKYEILIHFYGYVCYAHNSYTKDPIIVYPNENINGKRATEKQKDMLFRILNNNDELDEVNFNYDDNTLDDVHDSYVNRFISDEIEGKMIK